MRTWLRIAALISLCSCSSVEWNEVPADLPSAWRHFEVFPRDDAIVLASSRAAAEEGYLAVSEILDAIRAETDVSPGRSLILVESYDDPELLEADDLLALKSTAHAAVVGGTAPVRIDSTRLGLGEDVDLDPGLLLRLIPSAIPQSDAQLGLPRALVDATEWIVLMPSTTCEDEIVSDLLEAGMKEQELSFIERSFASLMWGTLVDRASERIRSRMRPRLIETAFHASGVPPEDTEVLSRILSRLGLIDPEPASGLDALADVVFHQSGYAYVPERVPSMYELVNLKEVGYTTFVDLRPDLDEDTAALLASMRVRQVRLPLAAAPSAAELEQLRALREEGAVFLIGDAATSARAVVQALQQR